jgi:DNA-binding transcriptional LysR family regulator
VPKDILDHQCITFSRSGNTAPWTFKNPAGRTNHITPKSRLLLNSAESAVDSALQDCGLTQLYSYQAAPYIARGELEIVLEHYEITPPPVSLIVSHGQRIPQKIKAFTDFAVPILRESLRDISQLCDVEPK